MKWQRLFLKNVLNKTQKREKFGIKFVIVQLMEKNIVHRK